MSGAFGRIAGCLFVLGGALTLPAAQPARDPAKVEAELKALNERIERLTRQSQQDVLARNRLDRELRDADRAVASAQGELRKLRAERSERAAVRQQLEKEHAEREKARKGMLADLERQLRAAYFMGRNEPLKLLLNQGSPAEFSRNLAYYGYLARQRVSQIGKINEEVARIKQLSTQIEAEDRRLAELEQAQRQKVSELESARKRQQQVLVSLDREASNRNAELRRLREQRAAQEKLIEQLRQAVRSSVPYDPDAPFGATPMNWPVAGKLSVSFGTPIPGLGTAQYIEIDTIEGAPVQAVHEGQVVYADWLSGRGLVVIINHGSYRGREHMTLYAHLGELYVRNLEVVRGGQIIGTAGRSGGRREPGLYFEVRRNGSPIDPRPLFRTAAPPAR
jgi:septal ring factor EnvC (AmiA/AmiB activator)